MMTVLLILFLGIIYVVLFEINGQLKIASSVESNIFNMKLFLFLCCFCAVSWANKVDYTGYKIVRVTPNSAEQFSYVQNVGKRIGTVMIWSRPNRVGQPFYLLVDGGHFKVLLRALVSAKLQVDVAHDNLQRLLEERETEIRTKNQLRYSKAGFDFENFHSYQEIVDYLVELPTISNLTSVTVIGSTFEGRNIYMSTIGNGSDPNKAAIYLECGMHAREWISHATCLWIINELVSNYGIDSEMTALVNQFDWLITPVSNPDGYIYSWENDRLWRKNRNPSQVSNCFGVDANRNFDAQFGGIGASSDPCSATYHGTSAFSEAESKAMRDVLLANARRMKASVSIHSNAQVWISPYGYTNTLPLDYPEMEKIMKSGADAIFQTNGQTYQYGAGADVLYFTSGTTKDYAYDGVGIIHAYTLELRNSEFGFVPPATDIRPVATEAWNGLKAMAKAIVQNKSPV